MKKITTVGLDLAKGVFQVHAVDALGEVVVRKSLRRAKVLDWFARLEPCLVGMEACAGAHYWARELKKLGHDARLIPPAYAKAYVRRNKHDPADAAAICEAVSRPSMRFVAIKTELQQAKAGIHRVRDLLTKQHTMLINQMRGLMAEFGIVAAKGVPHVDELLAVLADPDDGRIPDGLRDALRATAELLATIDRKLERIDRQLVAMGRDDPNYRRLIKVPGYGVVLSSAMSAMVVDPAAFRSARLCRLARSGAASRRHGWQGQARADLQARQPLPAPLAGQRRDGRAQGQASQARPLAYQAARQQAAQGRRGRAGQQNGAHRMGSDDASGGLPASAGGGLKPPTPAGPEGLRG